MTGLLMPEVALSKVPVDKAIGGTTIYTAAFTVGTRGFFMP